MKFANFSVKNSLLVNLISVFIIAFGLISMFNLRREAFPAVSFDEIMITSIYPGAPAEDVEKVVTNPIEKEVRGVSGVREIVSKSEEGVSTINVVIEPGVLDKEKVVDDIRRAVDRVRNLPAEMEEDPLVIELSSEEFPVFQIALGGNFSEAELRVYAEQLEDIILDITGVATVRRYGWRDPEFHVEVHPNRLAELHVSIEEIMRALASRNISLPAGLIRTGEYEYNIRTTGEFDTVEEIENVIIRANEAGNWLRIKDVGTVREGFAVASNIMKTNGSLTLTMVVIKTRESDIIRLVNRVKKELELFEKTLPEGMEITISNDYSYYVQRRLNVLRNNGIIGLILVLLVLFIFLDPVPAVTTALGIPMALFSTFAVMYIFDISVNLISMLGLIIVLGMLVDDGIIVSENVFRYVEEGMDPKEASIKGTNEVVLPVLATILTTWAAFAPLLFMRDIMGKFIREIPLTVIIALGASLFQAFIILPSHLSDLMHIKNGGGKLKKKEPRKWFRGLQNLYKRVLTMCLDYRYLFFAGLIVLFVGTMFLASKTMRYVGFKDDGIEMFYVKAEAPNGTSLYRTNELSVEIEKIIAGLSNDELESYETYIGAQEEDRTFDPAAKKSVESFNDNGEFDTGSVASTHSSRDCC
jgi:multidrug efflux pump subunit AcrB